LPLQARAKVLIIQTLRNRSDFFVGSCVGEPHVPQLAPSRDARDLATFGYRQRLDRTLGSCSSLAAGLSYLSILTGLPQLFYLGFAAGGPAFFWTWPTVFAGQFLVALCFAEQAARCPLSGGLYQWSKQIGPGWVGWMAGWISLACAVITLASVSLALQATLPQIGPWFQVIGDRGNPTSVAANAVLLGCVLLAFSTLVNAVGVRLLARINNVGAFAEMAGAVLLILLFFARARRGPEVVFDRQGRGDGMPFGYLGPFLAASLMPSFVMYGFDTAGTLAEETDDPRRRAPWAILLALISVGVVGALLILGALCSVGDLHDSTLGRISGGMPYIIKQVLGDRLGLALLCLVALAITVGTLTVHASGMRLVFAMARDNRLPFAQALAKVAETSRTPILPALLLGLSAAAILVVNAGFPQIIEVLASLAIAWANLAYLFVTVPMLLRRLGQGRGHDPPRVDRRFSLGRWGLPVNLMAVAWGLAIVVNVGWPRTEIYGITWYRRFSAPLATVVMLGLGVLYYGLVSRHKTGVLPEHRAVEYDEVEPC
jgi:urea carboxylase system permease